MPLGSARALEAQNNAHSDTNEPILFTAGKRAEEKGGSGRLQGPWSCFEDLSHCAHAQDKVAGGTHTVPRASAHLETLHLAWGLQGNAWHLSQLCLVASVRMAILELQDRQTQAILITTPVCGALWL